MSTSGTNRGIAEGLELTLGYSSPLKGRMLANNYIWGYPPNFIAIDDDDDDDDDVDIYSPGPSRETIRFFPRPSSWVRVLSEEDLELRLGIGGIRQSGNPSGERKISEGNQDQHDWNYGKQKCGQASTDYFTPDVKEVKLRCSICMDTMKEETSTICGHIFCKPCITDAVLAQKRCPACRAKISLQNIHRIYLPAATS